MSGKKTNKICKGCGKDFEALLIKVRQGKALFCSRECYTDYRRRNKKDPKERAIFHQKKYKYGLSEEEYKNLFIRQNNKCAICEIDFIDTSKACVDHDHNTNKVRGLLCHSCNRGLGYFRDNKLFLNKAIEYIGE